MQSRCCRAGRLGPDRVVDRYRLASRRMPRPPQRELAGDTGDAARGRRQGRDPGPVQGGWSPARRPRHRPAADDPAAALASTKGKLNEREQSDVGSTGHARPGAGDSRHRSRCRPYATCSGLAVHSIANNLPIFDRPYITSPRLETVQRGDYLYCAASGVRLGDRYDACGVTRANGWVAVHPSTGDGLRIGYAYMTCMRDG
jgi:hypothetical protein